MSEQDRLIQQTKELENSWKELDDKIDELTREIHEEEGVVSGDESPTPDSEEVSELSKSLREIESEKNAMMGSSYEEKDKAFFEENDFRKENTLLINELEKAIQYDISAMSLIMSEIPDSELYHEEAQNIKEALEQRQSEISALKQEWHSRDLPSLDVEHPKSDNNESNPTRQATGSGSLLDDYADTSAEPSDYFGGDD